MGFLLSPVTTKPITGAELTLERITPDTPRWSESECHAFDQAEQGADANRDLWDDIPYCVDALAITSLYGTSGDEHERHRRWWRNRLCHDLAAMSSRDARSLKALPDDELIAVARLAVTKCTG